MIQAVSLPRREIELIDGNSLAYRAYYALPENMTTSKGEPTNAVFGFATMLTKLLTRQGHKATIVVWDAGMSGRELQYEPYKADRKPRPDLLVEQWPHLEELVDALGYRNVAVDGFEADDVIASISEDAKKLGIAVAILTGDRDAYQLVEDSDPPVTVVTTTKGVSDTKTYDESAIVDRYGIKPEQITDMMGLRGDTSDNIPGVPGIGEKTATSLIQEYGSFDGVFENIDKISGKKRQQNLREFEEQARLSKDLVTLKRDIDHGLNLESELDQEIDTAKVRQTFMEFELREPLRRFEERFGESQASDETVESSEEISEEGTLSDLSKLIGEGGAALAVESRDQEIAWAVYGDGTCELQGSAKGAEDVFEAFGAKPLIMHDYKASVRAVAATEGESGSQAEKLAHDTMLAAYLLNPTRRKYPLLEIAEIEAVNMAESAESDICSEAKTVWKLASKQREQLEKRGLEKLFDEVELPLAKVLVDIERVGIKLDVYRLGEISDQVNDQVEELSHTIVELAGEEFTIGSPQQLAKILFEKLGLSRKRRGKTGYSTDARVLRSIRHEHEIVGKIEKWRELSKLKNTYLDALPEWISPETGRLHTTFNQAATATGRLSSTDPNLQNIPVRTPLGSQIRGCFVAPEGSVLLAADYSQVELRILAAIAGEDELKKIFARGEDVHTMTAAEVFEIPQEEVGTAERARAKAVNFGIVYGLSAHGLSEQLEIGYEEAQQFIDRYLGRFPAVEAFIKSTVERAEKDGYVTTLMGRVRDIPELRSRQGHTRQLGQRLAVNTVIQGTAADIIKIAMIGCQRELKKGKYKAKLVLQIHDELLFEAPEDESDEVGRLMCGIMESAYELDSPLKTDLGVGKTWLQAKA